MSQVPTSNVNALYSNSTPGTAISPTIFDAAVQDIVATINANDSKVDGLVTSGTLSPLPPVFQGRQGLINGNFDRWERGTSFTANTAYTADRWGLYHNHTSIGVTRQETFSPDGSRYVARLTNTTRGTGTFFKLAQAIETANCLAFINKTVTVSFQVRKNGALVAGDLVASVTQNATVDSSAVAVTNGTLAGSKTTSVGALSTTFQTITFTATIPATARTIAIHFDLNNSPTDGGYIEISEVQICAGDVALPFQPKSEPDNVRDTQRYTIAYSSTDVNNTIGLGYAGNTTTARIIIPLPTQMRLIPSLVATASDWQLTDGVSLYDLTAISILPNQNSNKTVTLLCTVAAGLTQFRPYQLVAKSANRLLILDAEL